MSAIEFYIRVIRALDEIQAPYMIVGAFAGYAYGIGRVTFDVDILVDLRNQDADALSARFPLPRYYADPEMIRNSMRMGIMFNLIDTEEGVKADLIPLKREPDYRIAFSRRVRQTLRDEQGNIFEAWVAQPTDIIVGKLEAWNEDKSVKHPTDIYQILVFAFSGLGTMQIDIDYVTKQASKLGKEALMLWQELVARARQDAEKKE